MAYPRPYYVLVLFYILISALLPDIIFLDLVCIAGEYGDFQKLYGNTKMKKWKPNSNVVTLQRCDFWSTAVKVKERTRTYGQERKTKQEQPERSKRLVFLYFFSQNH